MPAPASLPIWKIHDDILRTLHGGNRLVLVAPTGSGKTTQVPQMLLDAGITDDKMIVVLQPRRVAARTVATRVASERKCKLGAEVGYQIRFDDHTSPGTRIAFVTEGILLRWLQDDQTLAHIGAVVFDEFHERSLLSDVALALVKNLQQSQRPDLVMLVMSATLDAEPVAAYLDACPILISEGQSYPVEVGYLPRPDQRAITVQAAEAVERIINDNAPGDILVFMPGRGEINGTLDALRNLRTQERVACIPLHGALEPQEQDRAFAPNALRKVIVATNVAETSITIDGILHVVDSGVARVARYDAERGIGTLLLEPISRASADQRKGRAGRTASGSCHRLWTEGGQMNREERNTPEIQRSDLAEVVLLLHSLGIREAATFDWLDKPDLQAVERAELLLTMLGALPAGTAHTFRVSRQRNSADTRRPPIPAVGGIDITSDAGIKSNAVAVEFRKDSPIGHEKSGLNAELTPIGRQMLRLPMHPRYSRMLIEASQRGCVPDIALCAALVSGRDLLTRLNREDDKANTVRESFEDSEETDFVTLMSAFDFAKSNRFRFDPCRSHGINAHVARQVDETCQQILQVAHQQRLYDRKATPASPAKNDEALLRSLMAGFVDQLAKRREPGKPGCDLTERREGQLVRESVVQEAQFFVAANLHQVPSRGGTPLTLLSLATAVKTAWITEMFPQHLSTTLEHLFDAKNKRVAVMKLVRYRDLVIEQKPQQNDLDPLASGRCLADAYDSGAFDLPKMDHRVKQFIARVNLVHATLPELEFAPFDEAAITACLARAFTGLTGVKEAQAAPLLPAFHRHLEKGQISWLDELLPLSIPWVDTGSVKVSYLNESPEAQVKLKDCFELEEHPTLCEGRLPVLLNLYPPKGKCLASTTDWAHFRERELPKHRKVLAEKFPSHPWI
ncbi:MAG: ATP-dependent RNA helicase [Verrucomicrobiales bacterium]|nr:ATP-dependent RNA helicase [Verrucomicrobiales bacterium]